MAERNVTMSRFSARYRLLALGNGREPREAAELGRPSHTGMPVLFVPGYKGSFSQSRSLAAHASGSTLADSFDPNEAQPLLDCFTLDFGDNELSAFDSSLLWDQVRMLGLLSRVLSPVLVITACPVYSRRTLSSPCICRVLRPSS